MREIYSSFVRAPARYLVTVKIAIMPGISSMPIWDKNISKILSGLGILGLGPSSIEDHHAGL